MRFSNALLLVRFYAGATFFCSTRTTISSYYLCTDGVTGKAAQGVTTIIDTSTGSLYQNLGTVAENTTINLPTGTYVIKVQLSILGIPITMQSSTVNLNQPYTEELTVSALIIPIQYVSLLIYIIVIIIIVVIIIIILRSILKRATYKDPKQKKPT